MKIGYEYWYYNTQKNNEVEYYFFESVFKAIEFRKNNPHLEVKTIISEGVILY